MPEDVKDELGYALGVAQLGGKAQSANAMKGNLREVMEIISDDDGKTYRAMYTVELKGRVYVLDDLSEKIEVRNRHSESRPREDSPETERREAALQGKPSLKSGEAAGNSE